MQIYFIYFIYQANYYTSFKFECMTIPCVVVQLARNNHFIQVDKNQIFGRPPKEAEINIF